MTILSFDPDKFNLWPFYHLTLKCDLDLQTTCTIVSNGTATPQAEQLCHIILKSMHKCRSYGPDKLNWCDLQVRTWPSTYLQNCISPLQENNCAKLYWNPCINVEVMARTSSIYDHFIIWPGQAQFMTILSFDLQVWPWPSTYLYKCFKWHCFSSSRTTVPYHFDFKVKTCFSQKLKLIWKLKWEWEWKLIQMSGVTWPTWPPCPYMVKTLKNLPVQNQ